jgi:hypothetical protein
VILFSDLPILFSSKTGVTPTLVRRKEKGELLLPFAVQLCQKFGVNPPEIKA